MRPDHEELDLNDPCVLDERWDDEPTRPDRPANAVIAFRYAISQVHTKCDELACALDDGYPIDIELAANELAGAWSAAAETTADLHHHLLDAQEQANMAMAALRISHRVLREVFDRSTGSDPATNLPRLQDVLLGLWSRIDEHMKEREWSWQLPGRFVCVAKKEGIPRG